MGTSRKSYAQLEAEIQALIKKREAVIEDSADILKKAILTKEVKNRIATEPTDIIKAVGKKIAESIDKYIDEAKKQADAKGAPRPHPAKNTPEEEPKKHKIDYSSATLESASGARSSGASSAGTQAAEKHQY